MSPTLAAWLQSDRTWLWNNHRIFYRDEGSGPTVLLLHGYPTGSFDWQPIWHLITQDRRVVAPDFLGMGFSDKPSDHVYSLGSHAQSVDDLLLALKTDEVHVVAHDIGVRVVQEMLARRELCAGLPSLASVVLLNGAMCPEAYKPRFVQRLLASRIGGLLAPRLPRQAFDSALRRLSGQASTLPDALLEDFWVLFNLNSGRRLAHEVGAFWLPEFAMRDRLVGALLRTQVPVRVINGDADPNSGRHMMSRLIELAPRTDIVVLPRVGHWPHIEAPHSTYRAIAEFWLAVSKRGAPSAETGSTAGMNDLVAHRPRQLVRS